MLKRLILEIHRRSLWQVLAIFLASGWVVLQVIDVLINHGVLPGWVFRGALVLLLLGLPVVVATAFVQEGIGGASGRAAPDPPDPGAPAPTGPTRPAPGTVAAHHRLFTWRNAILGGIGAFALLGVATAGYMTMRTLGMGAPGTLLAQGVIERGAPVLVADFEAADDAELGLVMTRALRIDLLQSPAIHVLERTELGDALERMRVPEGAPLSAAVARQLAQREGYAAVIAGDIAPLGNGYVLTASIVGGEDFGRLAGFRETARTEADLIDAVERLSRSIRDKIGESLRSVRGAPSLARVTTASLPALRAYTRGSELHDAGDYTAALDHFERAVAIDTAFAMAHQKLAAALINLRVRTADVRRAMLRAYQHRDRLPELERHVVTGFYHYQVTGDPAAAVRAYEQALLIDSTSATVRNSLANLYSLLGREADAEPLYALSPAERSLGVWRNLAVSRFALHGLPAARATLDSAAESGADEAALLESRFHIVAAAGEYDEADSVIRRLEARTANAADRTRVRYDRFLLALLQGRLADAERVLNAPRAELFMAQPLTRSTFSALVRLERGDTAAAVQLVRDAFADHGATAEVVDVANLTGVLANARAGQLAGQILDAWLAEAPADQLGFIGQINLQSARVNVARAGGDLRGALEMADAMRERCPGCGAPLTNEIARLRDELGDPDRAIAEYERSLQERDAYKIPNGMPVARTLRRLAELYDARGDEAKAAEYYARFIELWQDADAELQPQVRAAQARLERLLPDR